MAVRADRAHRRGARPPRRRDRARLRGVPAPPYRLASFCLALAPADPARAAEKVTVAAALHDVGIWTARTFDDLEPSVRAAVAYLDRVDQAAWAPEITAMIREHHTLTPSHAPGDRSPATLPR